MILIQEITHKNRTALIYRRDDGRYEGRIYPTELTQLISVDALYRTGCDFYPCEVAETLPRLQEIIGRELGFAVRAQPAGNEHYSFDDSYNKGNGIYGNRAL